MEEFFEKVAQEEHYIIEYNEANNLIAMRFYGDMNDEVYKEMWQKSLDKVLHHKIRRFLVDQREIGNVSFSARAWVLVKVMPQVKKNIPSPFYGAILPSANMVHSTGMTFLKKGFQKISKVMLQNFEVENEARNWLVESEAV